MYGILVIPHGEFERIPIYKFERELNEKRIALKVITGYQFDNTHYSTTSIRGTLFSFSVSRTQAKRGSMAHEELQETFGKSVDLGKVYEIRIWDGRGDLSVYHKTFIVNTYDDPIPPEIISSMKEKMELSEDGKYTCSDCGDITVPSGRYFASSFCKDCWYGAKGDHKDRGGWKKVEAEESYN